MPIHSLSPGSQSLGMMISYNNNSSSIANTIRPINYLKTVGKFGPSPVLSNTTRRSVNGFTFGAIPKNVFIKSSDYFPTARALYTGSIFPQYLNSINSIESSSTVRTTSAIRTGKYNFFTNKYSPGYPVKSIDNFGNDNAARSSYDSPGTITYLSNGRDIISQNYEAKG